MTVINMDGYIYRHGKEQYAIWQEHNKEMRDKCISMCNISK